MVSIELSGFAELDCILRHQRGLHIPLADCHTGSRVTEQVGLQSLLAGRRIGLGSLDLS